MLKFEIILKEKKGKIYQESRTIYFLELAMLWPGCLREDKSLHPFMFPFLYLLNEGVGLDYLKFLIDPTLKSFSGPRTLQLGVRQDWDKV